MARSSSTGTLSFTKETGHYDLKQRLHNITYLMLKLSTTWLMNANDMFAKGLTVVRRWSYIGCLPKSVTVMTPVTFLMSQAIYDFFSTDI